MPATPADQPSAIENPSPLSEADPIATPSSDFGAHVVMFWLLAAMAALVFAPCILIPIWLETEDLVRAERDVTSRTDELKAHIAEQDRLLKALTSDPLVNERIARRDLRFRRNGEQVEPLQDRAAPLPLELETSLAAWPEHQAPAPPEPPAVIKLTRRWLPDLPWVEMFARSPDRTIFLLMASGLLVAAFVLYGHVEPRTPGRADSSRRAA